MTSTGGIAGFLALGVLGVVGCASSAKTCDVGGTSHVVGTSFALAGCGTCTCDAFGDVSCSVASCSGPYHPPHADGGDAADVARDTDDAPTETASDAGPHACRVNADCAAGTVCFVGLVSVCPATPTGMCVARLGPTCPQTVGGGCPCLDVEPIACGSGVSACRGDDVPTSCWTCYLPS